MRESLMPRMLYFSIHMYVPTLAASCTSHQKMQYSQMYTANSLGDSSARPTTSWPSTCPRGQKHASKVDKAREKQAAPRRIGEGVEDQKKPSWVRAENRVRKSLMDTFRYMMVVICPYEISPIPISFRILPSFQESMTKYRSNSEEIRATAARTEEIRKSTGRFQVLGYLEGDTLSYPIEISVPSLSKVINISMSTGSLK
mmetsp:Transcript_49060/g.122682  ORF Transcript_49060/g.122682 Transcript_49060/m.122682 type:complete len:200 (-) Transcript_49060:111-710(-)